MEFKDIEAIILSDRGSYGSKSIELRASYNDSLILDCEEDDYSYVIDKNRLFIHNYEGIVNVPAKTGIQIRSDAEICGTIISPAWISGSGNLNLLILESNDIDITSGSTKKIYIESQGILRINNDIQDSRGQETIKYTYNGGERYWDLMTQYLLRQNRETGLPMIKSDKDGAYADFQNAKFRHYDIDACIENNIVAIFNDGIMNILYDDVNDGTPSMKKYFSGQRSLLRKFRIEQKITNIQDRIKTLEDEFAKAMEDERFEDASRFKEEKDRLMGLDGNK